MLQKILHTNDDFTVTILRLVLGIVVFAHGAQKIFGWFGGRGLSGTIGFYGQMGFPSVLGFLAIMVEFLGGAALIVGFLSRIAAIGVIAKLLTAVLTLNVQNGFFMNWSGNQKGEGYEFHLLAMALGLAIVVKGAGGFSVDKALSKKST